MVWLGVPVLAGLVAMVNGQGFDLIRCADIERGGFLREDCTIAAHQTPMLIRSNLRVMDKVTLTLSPGVELRFAKRAMLAVNGTLRAQGRPGARIRLTRADGPAQQEPQWPADARLVDERTVMEGRLQLLYQGAWRGVCANNVNWTQADANVTCRQLGFEWGNFSFMSFATNDSQYMLYYMPGCNGTEYNVLHCPNKTKIEIGSRICVNQQTIHLKCYGHAPNTVDDYWWGLEFYNSTIRVHSEGAIYINESASLLEHVDVEYAGVDPLGQPVPAIRASPHAPALVHVGIRFCALDGTNFTDIKSHTIVHDSVMEKNRGNGLVVESHYGRVTITDTTMRNNQGNGLKAKFIDGHYLYFHDDDTFCHVPDQSSPRYPTVMVGIPVRGLAVPCSKIFRTNPGEILTLNVLEMDLEPGAWGELRIYDGRTTAHRLIAAWQVINATLPQGVTSTREYLTVDFKWRLPHQCLTVRECVKFTVMVDSGPELVPEMYMNNTVLTNNTQHGIFMENVRNYVFIGHSTMSHNRYGAGLRVVGGGGDIHVNVSRILHNRDNGVNITYAGGMRIFNLTQVDNNFGNGINITFNETRVDNQTRYARHQLTEIMGCTFRLNQGIGVFVGNFCESAHHVVNNSLFEYNRGGGVEFESCYKLVPPTNVTNMTVGYCDFKGNYGHAVKVKPLINAEGRIGNNTFKDHTRHTLLLDNTDDFLLSQFYQQLKVDYVVSSNTFRNNSGFYVANVRLTERSSHQKMQFTHNRFEENVIDGAFPTINQRTRAYAVVILSSSNVRFKRNILNNPRSRYEMATHLLDRSVQLQAEECYWGRTSPRNPELVNYTIVIHRIFDQFSRFNLATLQYHPALKYPLPFITDARVCCSDKQLPATIKFNRGFTLGGRLDQHFRTARDQVYRVDRDITVLPEGTLEVEPGTVLEFDNSIGMLVHGKLVIRGVAGNEVELIMANTSVATPTMMRGADGNEARALLSGGPTAVNHSLVRLVDGRGENQGRLEVRPTPEDTWGTVCDKGWSITDANVVCQMLGLVVHPDDWRVYNNIPGALGQPIYRSNVACTDLDMDLLQCAADGPRDHSCTHARDVYVICHPPTWAGIQFLATAKPSEIRHAVITEAGLMDPSRITYSPAISIHYNVHTLEHINVTKCASTGVEVFYNDVYKHARVGYSNIIDNLGNGVSTRTAFFGVHFSTVANNYRAGIEYNPYITTYEAQQVRLGITDPFVLDRNAPPSLLVENEGWRFLVTRQNSQAEDHLYEVELRARDRHRMVVDILDYSPNVGEENVTVYDSSRAGIVEGTRRWRVDLDMVDSPVESASTAVTLRWHVRGKSSGRLALVARSKPSSWDYPWAKFEVRNTTVMSNRKGVVTRHYNQPSNEFQDLFFRYRWQPIIFHGVEFKDNVEEALHVPSRTKYHENYMPTLEELQAPFRVAEIMYTIEFSEVRGNGLGVAGEHNHVEFSNNVWLWELTNSLFENNRGGGFTIELPRVNLMYQELYNHTVDVNDTIFRDNKLFELRVDGFYCNSSMARNLFQRNTCKLGCISITGTEKDMDIHDNEIYENTGKYIVLFDMTSHTPYNKLVDAKFVYNNLKRNRKLSGIRSSGPSSSPASYTLGVRGVQNITINRNLLANHLDYELIGGQASSALETYLDVTENYWGVTEQPRIRELIFDFDDWNNYAIAEYFPHLLFDNFDSARASGEKYQPKLDLNKPLGGRVTAPLTLTYRKEPYIVRSDLTVMPTASLVIEAGVELQFYPNVGILVLGSMRALGKQGKRTKFGPVPKTLAYRTKRHVEETAADTSRSKRSTWFQTIGINSPLLEKADQVRLVGGARPFEGFLQIYNTTEKRWTLTCDHNFNDRTAEVACRTMNMEDSNVVVRRSRYYDIFVLGYPIMHEQRTEWFWRRTFICDGSEANLDQCRYKLNYNIRRCMDNRRYVFVRCGPRNIPERYEYWGNIRLSTKEYESRRVSAGDNVMDFVDIYGAGILHEEKASAVQAVHRVPVTNHVRITNCASAGYDYVAPAGEFLIDNNFIENNNGYGIGSLVLNGESDYETPLASFQPLVDSNIPYNVFGLVRMCTTEKLIYVRDRILLYYKYNFKTIDCIKIVRSIEPKKRVALRFLQLNMYNDTFYKNAVELYNGEIFEPASLIGEVHYNSSDDAKRLKYETAQYFDTMGIRVTGSPAYGTYGFIAEVVTVPYTPSHRPELDLSKNRQRIWRTAMTGNEGGGFRFENVGESNPNIVVEGCRIQGGGLALLNITSAPMMYMNIQNSRLMTIANNFLAYNHGGIYILAHTTRMTASLYSNITNNYITHNTHGSALHIEGHHFQAFEVTRNFIGHNEAAYRNVTAMFGVRLNFTSNTLWKNTGNCILNVSVPEQISVHQRFLHNAFDDNRAIGEKQTTIYANSAKHVFYKNFLLNRHNFFELVTVNRTKYINVGFPGYVAGETYGDDERYPQLDARENWWGQNSGAHVRGRIWDRDDDDNLIQVRFKPWEKTNLTVVDGRCRAGWRLFNYKCYMYIGGVVPYYEAWKECRHMGSRLALAKNRPTEDMLGELISSNQANFNPYWRTWVDHEWRDSSRCPVFRNYRIEMTEDCNQLFPFVCEHDPYIITDLEMQPITIAVSVTGGVLFVIFVLIGLAIFKSRKRTEQRLSRRNSLRASLRGSRATLNSTKSDNDLTASTPRKKRPPLSKVPHNLMSVTGATMDSSCDTIDKMKLDAMRHPSTPGGSTLNYSMDSIGKPDMDANGSYNSNMDRPGYLSRLQENEIANIMARPGMYDAASIQRSEYFDERSIDRSRMGLGPSPGPARMLGQSPLTLPPAQLPPYSHIDTRREPAYRPAEQDFSNPAFSPTGSTSPAETSSPVTELPPGFSAFYSAPRHTEAPPRPEYAPRADPAPEYTPERREAGVSKPARPALRQSYLQSQPVSMEPAPMPPPAVIRTRSQDSLGSLPSHGSGGGGGGKPPRPKPSETAI